ncbi:hypothetical protein [Aliidiomarina sedimenti]|uniref:hypothetical protein n=1 Tax=Aliidiomarina sedimenti TaxID=1933879 RepID=UPI000F88D9DB|nr:hypothetical protein [Aliidiomarina sedimenti]
MANWIATLSLSMLSLTLVACSSTPPSSPRSSVAAEGNTLVVDGFINQNTISQIKQFTAQQRFTSLRVNSEDGEPLAALQLGNWIHRNDLDVTVDGVCLRACANYIFTAGNDKHLRPGSIVAWSGGALEDSWTQQYQNYLMPGVRYILENYLDRLYRREARFFERTGVDQKITIYGHHPESGCSEQQAKNGFYYSVPHLLRMGVTKIYTDAHWSDAFAHYPEQYCEVELSSELEVFTI